MIVNFPHSFSLCVRGIVVALIVCVVFGTTANADTMEYFNHANFVAATSALTVIDFDDLASGNGALNGDEFVSVGVTISQRDGHPMNVIQPLSNSLNNVNSFPHGITSSFEAVGGNTFDDSITDNFDFTFSQPATAAGLWLGNIGPGATEIQFLSTDGAIIANEVIDIDQGHAGLIGSGFNNRIFYGITTDVSIGSIRTVEGISDGDGLVYDDIQFALIPEPATLAIFIFTSGAIARRRAVQRNN